MAEDNARYIAGANAGIVRNENDRDYGVVLEYARKGDWPSMDRFNQVNRGAINTPFGRWGQTALHVAVKAGNVEMVEKLVNLMTPRAMEIQSEGGNTALHEAAVGGIVQIAGCMLRTNPNLIEIADKDNWLPVTFAFRNNHREMSAYLLSKTTPEALSQQGGICQSVFLEISINSQLLDLVLKALDDHPRLVAAKYPDGANALLRILSRTPAIFPSSGLKLLGYGHRLLYSDIASPPVTSNGVRRHSGSKWQGLVRNFFELIAKQRGLARNLLELIAPDDLKKKYAYSSMLLDRGCQYISELNYSDRDKIGLSEDIHIAAAFGIVEPIVEITKAHPDTLDTVRRDGKDIIMVSIENRQEKIFSLWYGIIRPYHWEKKANTVDDEKNGPLHLAAMLPPTSALSHIPGAALQMQRELQWYKEVEGIVNPAAKFYKNKKGQTPEQVFSESHKELVKEGEKWMKDTATSYTVVGALIITIMFAAAFTVPGGNIQDIGIPVFLHKKAFTAFMVSDAISLLTATTSVLVYLGILTSPYTEQDFLISLPSKLQFGFSMLFISVVTMMVAFCAALILTLNGRLEVIIPAVLLAYLAVFSFTFWQSPLLVEIGMAGYGPSPSIFDRKMKPWY